MGADIWFFFSGSNQLLQLRRGKYLQLPVLHGKQTVYQRDTDGQTEGVYQVQGPVCGEDLA